MPEPRDHSRRPADWRPEGPWEGWVECRCGSRHWGRNGAAGLLILRPGAGPSAHPHDGDHPVRTAPATHPEGPGHRDQPDLPVHSIQGHSHGDAPAHTRSAVGPPAVLLQHRATWTHFGGTWGVPGGAIHPDESAWAGAVREASEEAGVTATSVAPLATSVFTHPDWSYTTVLARAVGPLTARPTDAESAAIEWVDLAAVPDLPLLPAFADAWPMLRTMLSQQPALVVDAANVVGSRPDGWWKDRAGATRRLLTRLDMLAADGVPADLLGLPGHTWWPEVVLVTEGAARAVAPEESASVRIVPASGDGDSAIVAEVDALVGAGRAPVTVVTADRGLIERVTAAGARHVGPRSIVGT
ncbi:NUDIX domain-containing protein [Ruania halotolerans]|uniref:NUDIX domain-containing protein n=1 Tax=Ruania halotolerans TaxID=2897773 RepID=UPI001E3474B2|nr:NUDIX hydrolase [Ruania halotolerans]UFU07503.1 NUDIX hydrolase [Ruania halotolerans]